MGSCSGSRSRSIARAGPRADGGRLTSPPTKNPFTRRGAPLRWVPRHLLAARDRIGADCLE